MCRPRPALGDHRERAHYRAEEEPAPHQVGRSTFFKILRNPYYIGTVRCRGAEHPGNHEPLIDIETWQRVHPCWAPARLRGSASAPTTTT
ncbi:recombinase family protein [Pseudoclavibacter sp. CFCC 13796]|uniref:recombinase family protein n=1 Tax=Pseudoclavibacter sp. CFCC 13796 TaxID=2615179 RepID=UPI00399F63FB